MDFSKYYAENPKYFVDFSMYYVEFPTYDAGRPKYDAGSPGSYAVEAESDPLLPTTDVPKNLMDIPITKP